MCAATPRAERRVGAARGGFTLLEVLVALAIVSVALLASLRAAGGGTRAVDELRLRTLAGWVAENIVAQRRARGDWPPLGRSTGTTLQGGYRFDFREDVSATPDPAFRRFDVLVFPAGEQRAIARLSSVVSLPPQR